MAIYSCNLRSIGRTTHAEGTAGAHLLYIGRERAASELMAEHMPENPQQARTWMDRHEREARKNARLCDKLRVALPRELTAPQRAQLVRDLMADLTGGRVAWYASIHQDGKDAYNPHAHIVIVDRDITSGKRVLCLSDSMRDRQKKGLPGPTAVEWVRERWEHHANQALERAGHEARIDRRSLAAQGVERQAQIHIGPRAQHIDSQVRRPESKTVPDPTPRHPDRVIDYPMIDAGRTRRERNAEIIDLNLEREARSPHFEMRVMAQFEREQRSRDRLTEAQLIAAARRRTLEERRIRRAVAAQRRDIRAKRDAEGRFVGEWLRQRHLPETQALKAKHASERADLTRQQDKLFARFFAAIDLTGRTKRKREAARLALSARHRGEREVLAQRIREVRQVQRDAVEARYKPELADLTRERAQKLETLRERHEEERRREDALLQGREAERERMRAAVQQQIEAWRRMQRVGERQEHEHSQGPGTPSKAGRDWDRKDNDGDLAPEDRAEVARRRMEEAQQRNRERLRRRTRDFD